MTRNLSVAAIQTSYGMDLQANIKKTEAFIREAAAKGAQVILPSELKGSSGSGTLIRSADDSNISTLRGAKEDRATRKASFAVRNRDWCIDPEGL
jgi:predicted amidohydrolase